MSAVPFFGEQFDLNPEPSEYALMEFAEAAADGVDGDTMQGLAAMMRLVTECIDVKDRSRFRVLARKSKAGADDLTKVIQAAFKQETERPTGRPSDSSDGPTITAPRSVASSDDKPSRFAGRPDLELMVAARSA